MFNTHKFKWNEFLEFRKKHSLPAFSNEAKIEKKDELCLVVKWNEILMNNPVFDYSWEIEDGIIQERYEFPNLMNLVQETILTEHQKESFFEEWMKLKNVMSFHKIKHWFVDDQKLDGLFLMHRGFKYDLYAFCQDNDQLSRPYFARYSDSHMKWDFEVSRRGSIFSLILLSNGMFFIEDDYLKYPLDLPKFMWDGMPSESQNEKDIKKLEELKVKLIDWLIGYKPRYFEKVEPNRYEVLFTAPAAYKKDQKNV